MKPRPLPRELAKSKEWESWPTFDELKAKRPDLKLHKLRTLLRDVTCYRCPDQSARYVQEELDELIDEETEMREAVAPAIDGEGRQVPQLYDSMVLYRESMKLASELRRMVQDVSESALSPMRLGLELVRENVELLRRRVEHYEGTHDDTVMLREALMSQALDRDLRVKKAEGQGKLREQALGMAMAYLPTLIADLKTSAAHNPKAQAALNAIESLEPSVVDAIISEGNLSGEQLAAWSRMREMIKQPSQTNDNQKSNGHAPS